MPATAVAGGKGRSIKASTILRPGNSEAHQAPGDDEANTRLMSAAISEAPNDSLQDASRRGEVAAVPECSSKPWLADLVKTAASG